MAEGGQLEDLVITEDGEGGGEAEERAGGGGGGGGGEPRSEGPEGAEVEQRAAAAAAAEEEEEETGEKIADGSDAADEGLHEGAAGDAATHAEAAEAPEESRQEEAKKARRLTPDFPEALYELLCTLQEGRRLNDQRCSFRLEGGGRRRCHSEPNTAKPANRVVFSSMTSLQKEEFFDLVATAQARRLDDQRAQLERSSPAKAKGRSFRGSIRQLSLRRPEKPAPPPAPPAPPPKEDLYNMILTTQAQGRLEDQRSRAPGPMDDEDFFSLLLRVQGGRMEEQRTELPCMLQT